MQPRFKWTCSYQGTTWFYVTDETGATYELALRRDAPDYELAGANGDDCRRDILASVGLLRRSYTSTGRHGEVTRETLDAFNAWRLAEHLAHVAQLDSQPERYGVIPADDPLRAPPLVAWRGFYVIGEGWKRSDTYDQESWAGSPDPEPAAWLADLADAFDPT